MKVNDPNLSQLASTEASRAHGAAHATGTARAGVPSAGNAPGDDVHLSELVRSLRSLATESPERHAHLEQIARTYTRGEYKADPEAVASKIIDYAIKT